MEAGDKILISPDLTRFPSWVFTTVIEVENNSFVGIVISAETETGEIFSGHKIFV